MSLAILWFIVLAILWCGFLFLEGFDFGVGMLHDFVGSNDLERRVAINAIGPVWDGNEVWLIVAGAGMFAAFPELVCHHVLGLLRGSGAATRGAHHPRRLVRVPRPARPRRLALAVGRRHGPRQLPHPAARRGRPGQPGTRRADRRAHEYTGSFFTLLNPYWLFVGLTVLLLCLVHGATFLALKTKGVVQDRAEQVGGWLAPLAALFVIGFAIWTPVMAGHAARAFVPIVGVVGTLAAMWFIRARRNGWAFIATGVAMLASAATIFVFALSARHGLEHQPGLQPHGEQRIIVLVHPQGHDHGDGDLLPRRAHLSGLDLLRVPPPHRRRRRARRRGRRSGAGIGRAWVGRAGLTGSVAGRLAP